jgi:hypothetical protein
MRVPVQIERIDLDGDYAPVPSVQATCTRCGHRTQSYGTSGRSVRRCLATLREECPQGEKNYYVADDESAEDDTK